MRTNIDLIKMNIKQELKERKSNIKTLCEEMKEDRFFIYRMTDNAPVSKVIKIAHAIGCTTSDLLKGI